MKIGKYCAAGILAASMILGLAACGSVKFEPKETSIFVTKDRGVVSAEIESFDNSAYADNPRYKEEDLKAFVEETVIAYNQSASGLGYAYAKDAKDAKAEDTLPVAIESLTVKDNVATLILDYNSADAYLAFNGSADSVPVKDLIIGTVRDGVNSGLDFSGMLNADGSAADLEKLTSSEKYMLVAVTGTTVMKVEGDVKYMSPGVTLKDENTVVTTEDTCYIIFK